MAAPSGITWGSVKGSGTHRGRIGIYVSLSSTNTQTTRHCEIWFWSEYNCSDSSNTLYADFGTDVTSAITSRGSKSISCTATSQWSTSNQKKLGEYDYTYTRGTSAKTYKVYAKLTGIEYVGATMYASKSYTIPALPTYKVSYSANSGSGAPSAQTKTYGKTLTLSSTKPTRTGYTFQGWATSSSGSVAYAAGASYTSNSAVTLYAVWKINTYAISYNSNGGSGSISSQTKNYNSAITLSNGSAFSKTNYSLKGWATSQNGLVAYSLGASYNSNSSVTLYAVWELEYIKPRINNFTVERCTSNGTVDDEGTYAKISFDWVTSKTVSSIEINWYLGTSTTPAGSVTVSASGTSGSVSNKVIGGSLSSESTYVIEVVVTDSVDHSDLTKTLSGAKFPIDFLAGGTGVAFGKPAERNGVDFGMDAVLRSGKNFYGGGTDGQFYSMMNVTPVGDADNFHFGYGSYNNDYGNVYYNGNTIIARAKDSIEFDAPNGMTIRDNTSRIYGVRTDGAKREVINPMSAANNFSIGYGLYENADGNTNIYGNDVLICLAAANKTTFRPYLRKGDSFTMDIFTSGFVTNSSKDIYFLLPVNSPLAGSPTITASSLLGLILRQRNSSTGGSYTHGSGAGTYVKPASYTTFYYGLNGIGIRATMSSTTNAVNNSPVGITWSGKITLT